MISRLKRVPRQPPKSFEFLFFPFHVCQINKKNVASHPVINMLTQFIRPLPCPHPLSHQENREPGPPRHNNNSSAPPKTFRLCFLSQPLYFEHFSRLKLTNTFCSDRRRTAGSKNPSELIFWLSNCDALWPSIKSKENCKNLLIFCIFFIIKK